MIRAITPNDLKDLHNLLDRAFGQVYESDLVEKIRKSKYFIPELALAYEEDKVLKGFILFSKIKIVGKKNKEHTVLSLAPMAVAPEAQKMGYGKALIEAGLAKAKELEYGGVIVLGHPSYYPKFGFEKAAKWDINCSFMVPEESFMGLELEKGYFDGKAGLVVYPEEFENSF